MQRRRAWPGADALWTWHVGLGWGGLRAGALAAGHLALALFPSCSRAPEAQRVPPPRLTQRRPWLRSRPHPADTAGPLHHSGQCIHSVG